ncbi:hypothetical protein SRHO_G00179520 [Serrasalmus rhombeus]
MMLLCVVVWFLLSEVTGQPSVITVSGHVGGSVKIQCSHLFADTTTKYFCRDPCIYQHILIQSGQSPTGRYTLEDSGKLVFTVTITDLQKSDAGTYWCGVERSLKDTSHKVLLTVADAPSTADPARTVRSSEPTVLTGPREKSGTPLYIAAGIIVIIVCSIAAVIYTIRGPTRHSKQLQSDLISAMSSTAGLEEDLHSHVCFTVINCSAGFTSETPNNQALDNLLNSTEKGLLTHVIYSLDR